MKLILLDAKIRSRAGMINKTPQNIYNTFWNTSVICWWVTTLGSSVVWSSICCFLPTFMNVLLKKVQQRINYFWAVLEILVFQKLGSMAVASKQILSPSPQQFILIGVWIWIYKKLYINSSNYQHCKSCKTHN